MASRADPEGRGEDKPSHPRGLLKPCPWVATLCVCDSVVVQLHIFHGTPGTLGPQQVCVKLNWRVCPESFSPHSTKFYSFAQHIVVQFFLQSRPLARLFGSYSSVSGGRTSVTVLPLRRHGASSSCLRVRRVCRAGGGKRWRPSPLRAWLSGRRPQEDECASERYFPVAASVARRLLRRVH